MEGIRRILIMGASGSGTTTLGRAVAARLGWPVFDTDDFYWVPTLPPYVTKREKEKRMQMVMEAIRGNAALVMSGSVCGWGAELEWGFDLVIFLTVPTEVRLRRLVVRETARWGKVDPDFLEWAGLYDIGTREGRNRAMHEAWLAKVNCPVLRLDGEGGVEQRVEAVVTKAREMRRDGEGSGCQ